MSWYKEIYTTIVPYYKNLSYLSYQLYTPGKLYPLLKIIVNSVKDSLRLPAKLNYLCGSYVLHANRQKFNNIDPTCLLCKNSEENLEHFLLECVATDSVRKPIMKDITTELKQTSRIDYKTLETSEKLKILLDCTSFMNRITKKEEYQKLSSVEYHTRRLIHNMRLTRYNLLKDQRKL